MNIIFVILTVAVLALYSYVMYKMEQKQIKDYSVSFCEWVDSRFIRDGEMWLKISDYFEDYEAEGDEPPVAYTTNELFDIFKEVCMFKNMNSDADNECET